MAEPTNPSNPNFQQQIQQASTPTPAPSTSDPWLFGMDGVMSSGEAAEFKHQLMVGIGQVITNELHREQERAQETSQRWQNLAEGRDPDE